MSSVLPDDDNPGSRRLPGVYILPGLQLPRFDGTAACAEVDPDLHFPDTGGTPRFTKKLCGGCEIQRQCLQWSLDNREPYGTWGGVGQLKRAAILRDRGVA